MLNDQTLGDWLCDTIDKEVVNEIIVAANAVIDDLKNTSNMNIKKKMKESSHTIGYAINGMENKMNQEERQEKVERLISLMDDTVSDLLYYDREEDEDLSREDIDEILTEDVIDRMVDEFKRILMKNKVD